MREKKTQRRVQEDTRRETKQPVKRVQVLRACHDVYRVPRNGICQTGEIRADGDAERDQSAPVDTIPVSVSSIGIVESWDIDVLFLDEPVVGGEDTGDRGEEHSVSTHESEECICGFEDLPWNQDPATNDRGNDTPTLDVNKPREEDSQIVGSRDGVGGDICTNLCNVPRCSSEKGCCSSSMSISQPLFNDHERIPDQLPINNLSG